MMCCMYKHTYMTKKFSSVERDRIRTYAAEIKDELILRTTTRDFSRKLFHRLAISIGTRVFIAFFLVLYFPLQRNFLH